jgi:hypothetical protein
MKACLVLAAMAAAVDACSVSLRTNKFNADTFAAKLAEQVDGLCGGDYAAVKTLDCYLNTVGKFLPGAFDQLVNVETVSLINCYLTAVPDACHRTPRHAPTRRTLVPHSSPRLLTPLPLLISFRTD